MYYLLKIILKMYFPTKIVSLDSVCTRLVVVCALSSRGQAGSFTRHSHCGIK